MYIKSITLRQKSGSSSKPNAGSFFHRARIYISPEGETVMENLVEGRHTRPYTIYKKDVLPQLFRMLGLGGVHDLDRIKVGWSKKAGCTMCPCSPGFIVKAGNVPYDIYVTVTDKYVKQVEIKGKL